MENTSFLESSSLRIEFEKRVRCLELYGSSSGGYCDDAMNYFVVAHSHRESIGTSTKQGCEAINGVWSNRSRRYLKFGSFSRSRSSS